MALGVKRKTDEERALAVRVKEQRQREEDAQRAAAAIEKARLAFYATPAGCARQAFENGDRVFQYSIDVMSQQAIIVAMIGSTTSARTTDPSVILNSVCAEGWDIVNGSFVFVEQGQQSRDKFMSSGQNVAIQGTIVGYYLFRRSEENRVLPLAQPWQPAEAPEAAVRYRCPECGELSETDDATCVSCGWVPDAAEPAADF
jgi:hypothetical protein